MSGENNIQKRHKYSKYVIADANRWQQRPHTAMIDRTVSPGVKLAYEEGARGRSAFHSAFLCSSLRTAILKNVGRL